MNSKLGLLAIALAAAFATSAVGPATAWSEEEFHSEAAHSILDSEAETFQVLTLTESEIKCSEVNVDGTAESETADEFTVTPTYHFCALSGSFGTLTAHVEFEECAFQMTSRRTGNYGPLHVECPFEGTIHYKITLLGFKVECLTVPPQTPTLGGAKYSNSEASGKSAITVELLAQGVEYTTHMNCGGEGEPYETRNDALAEGSILMWARSTSGERLGIWWE